MQGYQIQDNDPSSNSNSIGFYEPKTGKAAIFDIGDYAQSLELFQGSEEGFDWFGFLMERKFAM